MVGKAYNYTLYTPENLAPSVYCIHIIHCFSSALTARVLHDITLARFPKWEKGIPANN